MLRKPSLCTFGCRVPPDVVLHVSSSTLMTTRSGSPSTSMSSSHCPSLMTISMTRSYLVGTFTMYSRVSLITHTTFISRSARSDDLTFSINYASVQHPTNCVEALLKTRYTSLDAFVGQVGRTSPMGSRPSWAIYQLCEFRSVRSIGYLTIRSAVIACGEL